MEKTQKMASKKSKGKKYKEKNDSQSFYKQNIE